MKQNLIRTTLGFLIGFPLTYTLVDILGFSSLVLNITLFVFYLGFYWLIDQIWIHFKKSDVNVVKTLIAIKDCRIQELEYELEDALNVLRENDSFNETRGFTL